ncbi:ATPase-stabilizing factor 15 kDa protein-like [Teratosphaeria destructans]|uniref:ATPase-stabilizing factor 15 kDa protein-like n=1 Tax=Teratosphaeria destructans TaxID=418781 RepID=A0A9W7SJM5_9PEZI|nr:ATPase-stabilizing factor 15 kDa protein-like [Teratosphaeria destructans]
MASNASELTHLPVTRTHKATDRDHVGLANGTAAPEEHLPRYFGKAGYAGNDPKDMKKAGGGKGNWGVGGMSELEDYNYNMSKQRRRTNSFSGAAGHSALKTKFEALDPEAIVEYDEEAHGPSAADLADQHELEKMSTGSSADTVDEEEGIAGDKK